MSQTETEILDRIDTWPEEDRAELAEIARAIEARRTGLYDLTPEEEKAIKEGLAELARGQWTSEEEMTVFWRRCGVL
jgi:predicted transcriptional regulator